MELETVSTPAASQTSQFSDVSEGAKNKSKSRRPMTAMILAIVLPVIGVLMAICLLLYLRRMKRRSRDSHVNPDDPNRVGVDEQEQEQEQQQGSSIPPPPTSQTNEQSIDHGHTLSARPPKIDFSWSNDSIRRSKFRLSGIELSAQDHHFTLPGIDEASRSNSQGISTAQITGSLASRMQILDTSLQEPAMASSASESGTTRNVQNRSPMMFGLQSIPGVKARLPARKSGAGHGAGIAIHSDADANRNSWRASWRSNPTNGTRRSTVVLESFPAPPMDRSRQGTIASRSDKMNSSRNLFSEADESLSFEAQRQKWHTERARARLEGAARFSNAGSWRVTSSPRSLWTGSKVSRATMERSATAMEDITNNKGNPHSRRPWSKWVGLGPIPSDHWKPTYSPDWHVGNIPGLRQKPSLASSRQFESLASTISQLGHDHRLPAQAESRESDWESDDSSQASQHSMSRQSWNSHRATNGGGQSQGRQSGLERTQSSQEGSFRFL